MKDINFNVPTIKSVVVVLDLCNKSHQLKRIGNETKRFIVVNYSALCRVKVRRTTESVRPNSYQGNGRVGGHSHCFPQQKLKGERRR